MITKIRDNGFTDCDFLDAAGHNVEVRFTQDVAGRANAGDLQCVSTSMARGFVTAGVAELTGKPAPIGAQAHE